MPRLAFAGGAGGGGASYRFSRWACPGPAARLHLSPTTRPLFSALINDYRVQNGLSPLGVSPTLTAAARWMSEDMAANGYLGHTRFPGPDPSERMTAFGYVGQRHAGRDRPRRQLHAGAGVRGLAQLAGAQRGHADSLALWWPAWGRPSTPVDYGWYWTVDFGDYDDSARHLAHAHRHAHSDTITDAIAHGVAHAPTPSPVAHADAHAGAHGGMSRRQASGRWRSGAAADDTPTVEALATCDSTAGGGGLLARSGVAGLAALLRRASRAQQSSRRWTTSRASWPWARNPRPSPAAGQ